MRKRVGLLLCLIVIFVLTTTTYASSVIESKVAIVVDGVRSDSITLSYKGTTYMALRDIVSAAGRPLTWNAEQNIVYIGTVSDEYTNLIKLSESILSRDEYSYVRKMLTKVIECNKYFNLFLTAYIDENYSAAMLVAENWESAMKEWEGTIAPSAFSSVQAEVNAYFSNNKVAAGYFYAAAASVNYKYIESGSNYRLLADKSLDRVLQKVESNLYGEEVD